MKHRPHGFAIATFVVIGMFCSAPIAFGQAGSTGTILGVVTDRLARPFPRECRSYKRRH